ncbi:ATP-grasp domain-containing protein [bacterium]|nr:ATP-grasp domain-containing protein [bacterium]
MSKPRVLFLMPTRTYRANSFLEASNKLNVDAVVGSDRRQALEAFTKGKTLTLDFHRLDSVQQSIVDFHQRYPLDAIIPVDDDTAVLAAMGAKALSIPFNSPDSVRATREKHRMRERLMKTGLPIPSAKVFSTGDDAPSLSRSMLYPCVLKPVFLAASRGVIRADDTNQFVVAFDRITKLLRSPELRKRGGQLSELILVEDYIPGIEVALEGIMCDGELKVLALFDKPDPLEGPYFEETIYVTPSRLTEETQQSIIDSTFAGAQALGLRHGPVHAELRVKDSEPWILEIAARSIGGLCARALRFDDGISLEELILRHGLGEDIAHLEREKLASGVMMLPIPRHGVLQEIRGLSAARSVHNIEDVKITVALEQEVIPLPEGDRYLGFIFARAATPEVVERSIRQAYAQMEFVILSE